MLVGMSTMLAMKTNIAEFEVAEDEMKAFMGAASNVARHYSVETTQKTLDWIAFAGIGVQIFGTRAVAIGLQLKNKERGKGGPSAVVPFPGSNASPHDFSAG